MCEYFLLTPEVSSNEEISPNFYMIEKFQNLVVSHYGDVVLSIFFNKGKILVKSLDF